MTLLGAANTGYEFRSSTILDFNPGTLVENLTAGIPAVGTIGGDNDSVVTTDDNGDDTGDATANTGIANPLYDAKVGEWIRFKSHSPQGSVGKFRIVLPSVEELAPDVRQAANELYTFMFLKVGSVG